ncbi:hypothetical protein ACI2JA_09785 [Alkalihalobacillus sp. NPDC078783]
MEVNRIFYKFSIPIGFCLMLTAFSLIMTWYVGTELRFDLQRVDEMIAPSEVSHLEYINYAFDRHFFPYPFLFTSASLVTTGLLLLALLVYIRTQRKVAG